MSDDEIELTRRRVLGGITTIGVASAAAGAGTMAYFSDDESSGGNTVSAGTLDLESASDGQLTASDIAPGDKVSGSIGTTYSSSSTISPVEVDLSDASISEPSESESGEYTTNVSASAFAKKLRLDTAEAHKNGIMTTDILASLSDGNSNGYVDLADFAANAPYDDAFGDVSPGDSVSLVLKMTFDTSAGNEFQSDGVTLSVTFDAQQPGAD